MNRLLFFQSQEEEPGQVRLREDQSQHLRQVLKVRSGQSLNAGIVNCSLGKVRVPDAEQLTVLPYERTADCEARPAVDLILALPRPQTLRKVLLAAPQLGIDRLWLIRSERVEKSFFHSPLLSRGEWRRQLLAGMEQAGCCRLPRLSVHSWFKEFSQDVLPRQIDSQSLRLLIHPGGGELSPKANWSGRQTLAIGPEGGWREHELEQFAASGFEHYGLGERILRVETAVCVSLARLNLMSRLFGV